MLLATPSKRTKYRIVSYRNVAYYFVSMLLAVPERSRYNEIRYVLSRYGWTENGLTSRIIQLTSFKYDIVNNTCNGGNFKNGDTSTQNIRKLLQLFFLFCFCFYHFVTELVNRRLVIGHGVPYRTSSQRLFMNDKQTKLNMNDKQSNGNNALLNNVTEATRRFLLFCARNTIFQRVQRRVALLLCLRALCCRYILSIVHI